MTLLGIFNLQAAHLLRKTEGNVVLVVCHASKGKEEEKASSRKASTATLDGIDKPSTLHCYILKLACLSKNFSNSYVDIIMSNLFNLFAIVSCQ